MPEEDYIEPQFSNPYDVGQSWYDINEFLNMSTEDQYNVMIGDLSSQWPNIEMTNPLVESLSGLYWHPEGGTGLGITGEGTDASYLHAAGGYIFDEEQGWIINPESTSPYDISYQDFISSGYGGMQDPMSMQEYMQDYIDDYSYSLLENFYETNLPFDYPMLYMGNYGQYLPTHYDAGEISSIHMLKDMEKDLLSSQYRMQAVDPYLQSVGVSNLSMSATKDNSFNNLMRSYSSIDSDRENLLRNQYTSWGDEFGASLGEFSEHYGSIEGMYEEGDLDAIITFPHSGNWIEGFSGTELSMGDCIQIQAGNYLDEGWAGDSFAEASANCSYLASIYSSAGSPWVGGGE